MRAPDRNPSSPQQALAVIDERSEFVTESGCKLWTAATKAAGYGHVVYQGKLWAAHRLAWFLERGPIPPKMVVMHKCDTPSCVNTNHLRLGTQRDNVLDMVKKGRGGQPVGAECHKAKLTEAQVKEILVSNLSNSEISRQIGVHNATISAIRNGRSWRSVTGLPLHPKVAKKRIANAVGIGGDCNERP